MCDSCSTFFRCRRDLFDACEGSYKRGMLRPFSFSEQYDKRGNLVGELRAGWLSANWVKNLANIKTNAASLGRIGGEPQEPESEEDKLQPK
jgi:hypothetical protein